MFIIGVGSRLWPRGKAKKWILAGGAVPQQKLAQHLAALGVGSLQVNAPTDLRYFNLSAQRGPEEYIACLVDEDCPVRACNFDEHGPSRRLGGVTFLGLGLTRAIPAWGHSATVAWAMELK